MLFNRNTAPLLKYLSDPALKQLCNGQLLQQLLDVIADPPTLWNALLQLHKDRLLTQDSEYSFAWLLLELLSSPDNGTIHIQEAATRVTDNRSLLDSPSHDVRTFGYRIEQILLTRSSGALANAECAPGGRHDNDLADFRKVAILPTLDEFISSDRPFYRRADAIGEASPEQRVGLHLDNQFRLLREDMLGELRNDFQIAMGLRKGERSVVLRGLSLEGIECGTTQKRKPCALAFRCETGLRQLSNLDPSKRKDFLDANRYFLKHQAFGCLVNESQIVAFATVDRNENLLMRDIPIVVLQPAGDDAIKQILLAVKQFGRLEFVSVDTAIFAYEPVLKCLQLKTGLSLADELLSWNSAQDTRKSPFHSHSIVQRIKESGGLDLQRLLRTTKPIHLDGSQTESLVAGLTQALSLIQGPPGTGKSFIGALLAKILHDHTDKTVLVICYTNHALDQFLGELLDIGIPAESMVRLGAKSTDKTKCLNIYEQSSSYKRSKASYDLMDKLKDNADRREDDLQNALDLYRNLRTSWNAILEYLEFSEADGHFYAALSIPAQEGDMTRVGKKGKAARPDYLFDRWSAGRDAGIFQGVIPQEHARIWEMDARSRRACIEEWTLALLQEEVAKVHSRAQLFNSTQNCWNEVRNERAAHTIRAKRTIGCTTTAAAKYTRDLQSASPGIVLVEEAGEILESHILTAMTPETEHLILIGDHRQLRPKVNNYALTVEKGDGYDLNRSLFERLVLAGYQHTTLRKQHRMSPEISSLVRHLTYPDLLDAPSTLNRDPIRGL
ncbi:MAG: hypothetical protein M1839_005971 [Geoglossum umbratile]|nr:MAG: hypothetical protein M1839_005971 [Geoglossum umbratile]